MGRIITAIALMLGATATPAQSPPQSPVPARLVEQYIPESTAPQETTAALGKSRKAQVHQWGIIAVPGQSEAPEEKGRPNAASFQLPLPDFVHTTDTPAHGRASRLEFSALYIHPPMMLDGPLTFDIRTGIRDGSIAAWYPYAPIVGNPDARIPDSLNSLLNWKNVLAGAQADTLKTTNSLWVLPRAVMTPATLKVYKPGPPGTQPDDPGTTEGEVFLFMRGQISGASIRSAMTDGGTALHLNVNPMAVATLRPSTTAPLHAWAIAPAPETNGEANYRLSYQSAASFSPTPLLPVEAGAPVISEDLVRASFNEAFVGHGLDPDEADALSRMTLKVVGKKPCSVVILPRRWVDAVIPLEISGSAAESPVRLFVAVCEMPHGTEHANLREL